LRDPLKLDGSADAGAFMPGTTKWNSRNVGSVDAENFDGFRLDSQNRYIAIRPFFFAADTLWRDVLQIEDNSCTTGQAAAPCCKALAGETLRDSGVVRSERAALRKRIRNQT
jgi:hypothetical protein